MIENDYQKNGNQTVFKGRKVLLIEDNEINQMIAVDIMETEGISVDIVATGEMAIEKIIENKYDAILMKLQMSGMNGYECAKEIRKSDAENHIPIIALTADNMIDIIGKIREAGMDECLAKPIDAEELLSTLKEWFEKSNVGKPVLPEEIPGINLKDALKRMLGNKNAYLKILKSFSEKNGNIIEEIMNCYENGDIQGAQLKVHTLKGVAGNIGADDLRKVIIEFEMAIKLEDDIEVYELEKRAGSALKDLLKTLKLFI